MTPSFDAEQRRVEQAWTMQDCFLELHSHWLTLMGEHLQDHQGNVLEYWRIEKADLKGVVEWEPFRKLLANLYFVYSILEAEIESHCDDPIVAAIHFPELNRAASL